MSHPNPFGRSYTPEEWAAAKRVGYPVTQRTPTKVWWNGGPKTMPGGPLIYANGPYEPERARQMADDWKVVADAIDREWQKEPQP